MVDREAEESKERGERKTRNWHNAYPESHLLDLGWL